MSSIWSRGASPWCQITTQQVGSVAFFNPRTVGVDGQERNLNVGPALLGWQEQDSHQSSDHNS